MNYSKNHIAIANIKLAFTLTEVLITLVVIGVIATLTIPALITNIQDSEYKAAWRKAFSDISQATKKLASENAGSLNGVFSNSDEIRDKLSPYLSYVQKCDEDSSIGPNKCWPTGTRKLSGNTFTEWNFYNWSRIVLSNGMLVAFNWMKADCTYDNAAKGNGCAQVAVNVNGFKEPNIVGKDIFFGLITEDGSFEPLGKHGDYWYNKSGYCCDLNDNANALGFTCSAQYLQQ